MFTSEGCSLPVGRLGLGIPIHLHWTFFLLLILELVIALVHVSVFGYTVLVIVLYGPVLLWTVVVHEHGHAWMNKKYGGSVDKIVLWPLGGYVVLGPTDGGVMEDFWVALSGPLTHIPMTALWFALYCVVARPIQFSHFFLHDITTLKGWFAMLFASAVRLNAIIFVFNLFIPAYPLDGGRCLAAILVGVGVAVPKAAVVTSITAMVMAVLMIFYGVLSIIQEEGGIMLILIGLFILYSSYALYRMTLAGKAYEHPLFARECYRRQPGSNGSGMNESSGTTNPPVAAAATTTKQGIMPSNPGGDMEIGNCSGTTKNSEQNETIKKSEDGPWWTNTAVTAQPSNNSNETGSNVTDRPRSGMGRLFRKESKRAKNLAAPDLTI